MSWTDKPNPEFEQWWATKKAAGYDYGREALENVRFGFEGAQERRWQPIETAPNREWVWVFLARKPDHHDRSICQTAAIKLNEKWWLSAGGSAGGICDEGYEPTRWMPLPDPPSFDQAGK